MHDFLVLRVVAKLLLPFIMVFALYIQFHGEYSPGGGFQAGVVFAAAYILYALVWGLENAEKVLPRGALRFGISAGLLLFAGVGIYDLLAGGQYLDYSVMSQIPVHGQHLGILLVELGVGITVASVMVTLFYTFAGYRR